MEINSFIGYTKRNKDKFICYCEILLDQDGNVYICNPCHTVTAVKLAYQIDGSTEEEIKKEIPELCLPLEWCVDKYGLIAIWYEGYMYSETYGISNKQNESIRILEENNLITKNKQFIMPANEYKKHLIRKEKYGID